MQQNEGCTNLANLKADTTGPNNQLHNRGILKDLQIVGVECANHISGTAASRDRTTNADSSVTYCSTDEVGKITSTTYTKDGKLAGKKIENPDGSYTERKLNPDGSIVFHEQRRNGSYVETYTDKNGTSRTIHTVITADSSFTTIFDPHGAVVRERLTQSDGSFSETTANKGGTKTKHEQQPNGDYSESVLNAKGELVTPILEVRATASPEFVQRTKDCIAKLPNNVKNALIDTGYKFIAAGTITEALPNLVKQTPRGYPPGSTWDDADGLHDGVNKLVVVAERSNLITSPRPESVVKHETGHAIDRILADYSKNNPDFQLAYDLDVAVMTREVREREEYFLQTGESGRSEAFAEVFAAINGAASSSHQTAETLKTFPNLARLLREKMSHFA